MAPSPGRLGQPRRELVGWSTDNPSNNYWHCYSFLRATMLFGLAARRAPWDAAGWLDFFREQKFQQDQLVLTFEGDLSPAAARARAPATAPRCTGCGSCTDLWEGSPARIGADHPHPGVDAA